MSRDEIILNQDSSLVEVIDRLIEKGVVLQGDAMLSVANVDLVYLGLRLVLCSADRLGDPIGREGTLPPPPDNLPTDSAPKVGAPSQTAEQVLAALDMTTSAQGQSPGRSLTTPQNPDAAADASSGVAQLILALVELLRELMERQAIRRMEDETITEAEVERMSAAFEQINDKMDELKDLFDLTDEDLNLDLGPLGNLLD